MANPTQVPANFKFGRNYSLTVERNGAGSQFSSNVPQVGFFTAEEVQKFQYLTVTTPFTLDFEVSRGYMGNNFARFKVNNLGPDSRYSILQPSFDQHNPHRIVSLKAGYGDIDKIPEIFRGWTYLCTSRREGVTTITEIIASSIGYVVINSRCDSLPTFGKGTPYNVILEALVNQLVKDGGQDSQGNNLVKVGQIKYFPFPAATSRDIVVSGNTIQRIKDLVGWNNFSMDNMVVNIRNANTPLNYAGTVTPVISSLSGIIGVPTIEGAFITINVIFEPTLQVGQAFILQSTELPNIFNGQYTIQGLHHKGKISGAECGDAITTIQASAVGNNILVGSQRGQSQQQ